MFKSTKEFDDAIYITLKRLVKGEKIGKPPEQFDKLDYSDILAHIVDTGLVIGATANRMANGTVLLNGDPRITRHGLTFIESFKEAQ